MPKQYPKDFKREAIRLSNLEDRTCVEVADELGIPVKTLYRWRSEAKQDGEEVFPGRGNQTPEEEELSKLRARVRQLEQERDILKKAMSIFADKERA